MARQGRNATPALEKAASTEATLSNSWDSTLESSNTQDLLSQFHQYFYSIYVFLGFWFLMQDKNNNIKYC